MSYFVFVSQLRLKYDNYFLTDIPGLIYKHNNYSVVWSWFFLLWIVTEINFHTCKPDTKTNHRGLIVTGAPLACPFLIGPQLFMFFYFFLMSPMPAECLSHRRIMLISPWLLCSASLCHLMLALYRIGTPLWCLEAASQPLKLHFKHFV